MKVGDLVKFKDNVQGMENMRGIIVAFNGIMPMVAWFTGRRSHPVVEIDSFLEVILNKGESPNV